MKLIRMATSQNTSVAEIVNELVRRAETTPDGRPAWAAVPEDEQTQLSPRPHSRAWSADRPGA